MRIELRDEYRRRIGWSVVDPAQHPTRVAVEAPRFSVDGLRRGGSLIRHQATPPSIAAPREVFLNWDSALDDAGQLRKCVACGCGDMFKEKAFPQVTSFIVALAFIGAVIGALGLATNMLVLFMMAIVLVLDVAILVFSRRRLVCYRCRTAYRDLPIARYHRSWDRAIADRHAAPAPRAGSQSELAAAAAAPGLASRSSQRGSLA